jgi:hypothetical protein
LVVSDKSRLQIRLLLPAGTQLVSRTWIKPSTDEALALRGVVGETKNAHDGR